MASVAVSSKRKAKPPRSHQPSSSAISQPVVQDASSTHHLSSFSADGRFFAILSLAVDKYRLRIYDTTSSQSIAEHVVDSARVTALIWSRLHLSDSPAQAEDVLSQPTKKRKKRRQSQPDAAPESVPDSSVQTVVLGLTNGTLILFSPSHGRVLRTLSHPSSSAAILSVVDVEETKFAGGILTSDADGYIRLWDITKNDIRESWKTDDRIPYSSMAVRPNTSIEDNRIQLLVAHHSIRLLSTVSALSDGVAADTQKFKELASFTGHASPVKTLQWDASQDPPARFISVAEADRFINLWEVPDVLGGTSVAGRLIASVSLDADVRSISLSVPLELSPGAHGRPQALVSLSASGKVCVFPVPVELGPPPDSKKRKQKVPTLTPRSTVTVSSKKSSFPIHVADMCFASETGHLRIVSILGGVRPVFDFVQYLENSGEYIKDVSVVKDDSSAVLMGDAPAPLGIGKRYNESTSLTVQSGGDIGHNEMMDDMPSADIDGALDVDLAELSLGQRLMAVSGADPTAQTSGADNSDEDALVQTRRRSTSRDVIPAKSLTRTLIQALHSSDARLLEMCLAHSDVALIRNSVRRLPPQLAVPLLSACTERLGRGARAANMKGRGGGASSQRGAVLIHWVKAVLVVHSGHLMTMPDLVARLAGLHAMLTSRLSLQESLLALNGRLELILSQIELRSSSAPAPLPLPKGQTPQAKREPRRYIEGESEEDEQMDVEIEEDNGDEGSVEDVELGGESYDEEDESSEDEDEEDDEEEEDEDDNSPGGPTMNGFIDDEAEEFDDEDEDDESE